MRGQKRVEDARKRAYDPRIHLLKDDGLHRNSGLPEFRNTRRRKSGKPDLILAAANRAMAWGVHSQIGHFRLTLGGGRKAGQVGTSERGINGHFDR
jgi:hypothetical protein